MYVVDVIIEHLPLTILGAITLIEIVPIKVNPWSWLFGVIGKMLLGGFIDEMRTFKREQEMKNANDMRWAIINFANSCRRGDVHSKDAWRHVLSQIKDYEAFCEAKKINNGVVDADSEYLHELFKERCRKNDFIK